MLSFGKSKRVANIVIEDYVIRMVENNGKDLASIKTTAEKALPNNTIQHGKIIDELRFYEFMKEVIQEWGIQKRNVRFYVPHALIIMKQFDIPEHVNKQEIKQYITMEIGNTIHFPFKNPVFDLYETAHTLAGNKVTVFAAPEDEIIKYTEVFDDVHITPVAVDVQPLGVYRYFLEEHQLQHNKVYLFFELTLVSTIVSIFHQQTIEFLRYQPLNVSIHDWQPNDEQAISWKFTGDETRLQGEMDDQLNEMERLMNFYRFTLRQGEKAVTDIILLGDFPELHEVVTKIKNRYDLPVTVLTTDHVQNRENGSVFIPALGLALKGGK